MYWYDIFPLQLFTVQHSKEHTISNDGKVERNRLFSIYLVFVSCLWKNTVKTRHLLHIALVYMLVYANCEFFISMSTNINNNFSFFRFDFECLLELQGTSLLSCTFTLFLSLSIHICSDKYEKLLYRNLYAWKINH